MTVRAKFKVTSIEQAQYGTNPPVEMRTINLSPVYSNDANSENRRFWEATPSGSIKLGTIIEAAWKEFELGGEYYVDFSKA